MGEIIKLPKIRLRKRKKLEDVLIEKLPDYEQHTSIGDVNFTCVNCGTTSHFKFNHIVFKNCEFYCSSCGTGYKISNPLFTKKSNIKTK